MGGRLLELLEPEEWIGRVWHRWASGVESYPDHPEAAVELQDMAPVLAVVFRAAGAGPGSELGAIAARESGHRLSLRQRLGTEREHMDVAQRREDSLLLPPRIALFADSTLNRNLYLWLAAHAAAIGDSPADDDPLRQDILRLRSGFHAAEATCREFPGLAARYRRLCASLLSLRPRRRLPPAEAALESAICRCLGGEPQGLPEADHFYQGVIHPDASLAGINAPRGYRPPLPVPLWPLAMRRDLHAGATAADDNDDEPAGRQQQEARPGKRKAQRRRQDQAERDDPLVFNRFEKILSFAEMVNVNRAVDDEDDERASRTADQMDEITLSPHAKRASSRLHIDLDLPARQDTGGALEGPVTYPEWHYRQRRYLPAHCSVYAGVQPAGDAIAEKTIAIRRHIRRVRRQFEALRPKRILLRGQRDGDELDIDAVVRAHADRVAGGVCSDRLFLQARSLERDMAVTTLVDTSLSTDAWVEDRRVIDVEKEALLVFANGLDAAGDEHAIYSFTSRRREKVWINTLKGWDDPMDERVERRIGSLSPGYYTRMGTAIRHASAELEQRPNRHRLLLLLTDGKPNDSDYYEGRYAIEDSRRAVLDARQRGIRVFAVTVDQSFQTYLPRIFGRGAFAVVQRPDHLPTSLPAIYRQLVSDR